VLGFTPEVLLLDLGLEHADGCELAVALKAMPDLRGCRLIACTGFTDALTRQRCVESGFDHHLPKPVDMNLLLQMIAGAA
jgi:CheY-like chemotaxis protein